MMLIVLSLLFIAVLVTITILFIYESVRELEPRAPIVGSAGLLFLLVLAAFTIFVPVSRIPITIMIFIGVLFGLCFLIPVTPRSRSLKGAMGYTVGSVTRFDQRDTVFARNRSLQPGSESYREYFSRHPEKEESDAKRRALGGLLGRIGAIDKQYRPNLEMIKSFVGLCTALRPHDKGFRLQKGDSPQLSKEPGEGPSEEKLEPDAPSVWRYAPSADRTVQFTGWFAGSSSGPLLQEKFFRSLIILFTAQNGAQERCRAG